MSKNIKQKEDLNTVSSDFVGVYYIVNRGCGAYLYLGVVTG